MWYNFEASGNWGFEIQTNTQTVTSKWSTGSANDSRRYRYILKEEVKTYSFFLNKISSQSTVNMFCVHSHDHFSTTASGLLYFCMKRMNKSTHWILLNPNSKAMRIIYSILCITLSKENSLTRASYSTRGVPTSILGQRQNMASGPIQTLWMKRPTEVWMDEVASGQKPPGVTFLGASLVEAQR
jgi:hypothetical protein